MNTSRFWHYLRRLTLLGVLGIAVSVGISSAVPPPTPVSLSQLPLTIVVPAHPQIILAVGNSESMDGNLSGAIMLGSGSLPAAGRAAAEFQLAAVLRDPRRLHPAAQSRGVGLCALHRQLRRQPRR